MPRFFFPAMLFIAFVLGSSTVATASVTVLHSFGSSATDGAIPQYDLEVVGSTLFGTTVLGGTEGLGTLFSLDTSDISYSVLHEFDSAGFASYLPVGAPRTSGSRLIGATTFGGENDEGTIYEINFDGTGFNQLHDFDSFDGVAGLPEAGVATSGGIVYGLAGYSAEIGLGAVYAFDTNTSAITSLHDFSSSGNEGSLFHLPLLPVGNTLFGVATFDGANGQGSVFKLSTSGTGFEILHEFGNAPNDGNSPSSALTLVGNTLFGVAVNGGVADGGVIYKIDQDGSNYSVVHYFSVSSADGVEPVGHLIEFESRLYGVTASGGEAQAGSIYSIATDGTGYQLHHVFQGGTAEGEFPTGALVNHGQLLYGLTQAGGTNGEGTIFSFDPNLVLGDFNSDGIVDAADYTTWRDSLGSTTSLAADATGNGVIDSADYDIWKLNFGAINPAALGAGQSPTTSVPEPSTMLLALLQFLLLASPSLSRKTCRVGGSVGPV